MVFRYEKMKKKAVSKEREIEGFRKNMQTLPIATGGEFTCIFAGYDAIIGQFKRVFQKFLLFVKLNLQRSNSSRKMRQTVMMLSSSGSSCCVNRLIIAVS